MNIGDLVRVKNSSKYLPGSIGIIIDSFINDLGFFDYEVKFEDNTVDWFNDLSLTIITENKKNHPECTLLYLFS